MARYKKTERNQSVLIPLNYSDQLIHGTIEFAIDDLVDNYIDISIFDQRYHNESAGAKSYPPSVLLKIILFAYSKGCYSSRKIQELCETNVLFISLTGNLAPDHSTIAAFISSMKKEVSIVFTNILFRCAQLDLIGGEVFALDGCKISSNAAKEFSGTFKELENKRNKLKTLCNSLIETHETGEREESISIEKRKEKYRRKIEKIDAFLKSSEPKKGSRGPELKSNITDNESAKMKSSNGIIQGYNGLAVVDDKNQVIVNAEAFGQGSEGNLLPGLVEQAGKNMNIIDSKWSLKNSQVIADTNYFSESNCKFFSDNEIDGYIPDVYFRNRDPRFPDNYPRRQSLKKNLFGHDKFKFNENENTLTCPEGNILRFECQRDNHGHFGRVYRIKDGSCSTCHRKTECLQKNAKARSVFITDIPKPMTFSDEMRNKIDTPHGRKMYSKRMGIVEPVFANIRYCKGLDRFTLRSKDKVNIQWMLYCCVHNIEKTLKAVE